MRTPHTNGFVEHMNSTLIDKCFRVKGPENWYVSILEMQRDLDTFMTYYNLERAHQSYRLNGAHIRAKHCAGPSAWSAFLNRASIPIPISPMNPFQQPNRRLPSYPNPRKFELTQKTRLPGNY